jgi:Acetone carboxylase gamma subunit
MADTPHPLSIAGGPCDGVTFPYIPKATLAIDPRLTLHTDWTDKIDPTTHEAHALRLDRPIQTANLPIGDPQRFIDARVEFRQFYCPACGGLIENEVCRAGDPLLHDIELAS